MNILDTLKLMVRHYPGGIESLAPRLSKAVSTLEKELRGAEGFKLGALDAEAISSMCLDAGSPHCRAYVNALAANCGSFVQLPVIEMAGDCIRTNLASVVKEASDLLIAGTAGLADDNISDNDRRQIDRELTELLERIQALQRNVAAAHEAGKRGRA